MDGRRKTRDRALVCSCGTFSPLNRVASDDEEVREIFSPREDTQVECPRAENKRNHVETPVTHTEPEKQPFPMNRSPLTHQMLGVDDLSPFTGDIPVTCKSNFTSLNLFRCNSGDQHANCSSTFDKYSLITCTYTVRFFSLVR
jgi:hypothetical protein